MRKPRRNFGIIVTKVLIENELWRGVLEMSFEYCEIVIRYNPRKMPSTSLFGLEQELKKIGETYTPKLQVRKEVVK